MINENNLINTEIESQGSQEPSSDNQINDNPELSSSVESKNLAENQTNHTNIENDNDKNNDKNNDHDKDNKEFSLSEIQTNNFSQIPNQNENLSNQSETKSNQWWEYFRVSLLTSFTNFGMLYIFQDFFKNSLSQNTSQYNQVCSKQNLEDLKIQERKKLLLNPKFLEDVTFLCDNQKNFKNTNFNDFFKKYDVQFHCDSINRLDLSKLKQMKQNNEDQQFWIFWIVILFILIILVKNFKKLKSIYEIISKNKINCINSK